MRHNMNNIKKFLVLIPMKDPSKSKSRLNKVLFAEARRRLALQLFKNTITTLKLCFERLPRLYDLAIVTDSNEVMDIASAHNVRVIKDYNAPLLSKAIDSAAVIAVRDGYEGVCVIPADLADPIPSDLEKLLSYPIKVNELVICPSIDYGTNALMVSPPNIIQFKYGKKSFFKHLHAGRIKGLITTVLPLDSIRFDVDTSTDLSRLFMQNPQIKSEVL